MQTKQLPETSKQLRTLIIKMIFSAQSGHPGGSLSCIDLLATLFFGGFLKYDPKNPDWEERDYCILSKGHASPALYSVLATAGYFPEEELYTFRQVSSMLQGHPSKKTTPGVEVSTGSLGQGLSVANGIALGLQMDNKPNKVWAFLGDGELQEGQIWEAAMSAAHFKLRNLIAVVDNNGLQIDGPNDEVMKVDPITEKFRSFGWEVLEVDGHNFEEISKIYQKALDVSNKPTAIIAHTIKGKGISFMENKAGWHGKAPNEEELQKALSELESAV